MARQARGAKDPERGKRFRGIWQGLFPGQSRAYAGEMLGVSGGTIRNWELGGMVPQDALERLETLGVSLAYLLRGEGPPLLPDDGAAPTTAEATAPTPPASAADPKLVARTIGANLKHVRKQRFPGWGGQKKFADFLGLSANDLCVYEYGRSMPNEHRLAEMAERLGVTPETLREPLPGVTVAAPATPPGMAGAFAGGEKAWHDKVDELRHTVARLEGRLEAMAEENARLGRRVEELQEANYTLRNLLYVDATPEARERRERLLEHLSPAIADLVRRREVF